MDGQLDFSGYTDRELREAQTTIDRSMFPLNASRLAEELKSRQLSGISIENRHSEKFPTHAPLPQLDASVTQIELVAIDALPPREQFRVFWGFMWRSYAVWLAAFAAAFVVAVIIGVLLGMLAPGVGIGGVELGRIQKIVGFVVGTLAGWFFSWHFLRWLLKTWIGRYRLLLGRLKSDDAV